MPAPKVRRVVTGHDADGKSIIAVDEETQGQRHTLIWTTDRTPADNMDPADGADVSIGLTIKDGSVFRIGELAPHYRSMMHRTNSVDYGLVLEGEVDMELDSGEVVHLKAGDVVVQRGTNHVWENKTDNPCRMAWILIDAGPVQVGDTTFEPTPYDALPPRG